MDPPWSPPSAIVTSPAATSAALPPDAPPVECFGLCGLRMGPVAQVWLPAEENPYNAWYWKTNIAGAKGGVLAGERVAV